MSENKQLGIEILLEKSRHLLEKSKTRDITVNVPIVDISPEFKEIFKNLGKAIESPEIKEVFENLGNAVENNFENFRYDTIKYQLVNKALRTGLWDMEVVAGDTANPNNRFIWSDEFRQLLGYTDENDFPNVMGSWINSIHPDDEERVLDAFVFHIIDETGKTPYNIEYQCRLKNDEYRWFHAIGETMRDDTGKPLRVAGLFLDIHEKKIALERDKQLREQLEYDFMKYQLATQAYNAGLWDMEVFTENPVNPNNKFIWSDEFRRMLGYTDEKDFPNITASWVDCIHPEDKDRVLDAFAKHLMDYSDKTPYNIEYRCQLKNGEYRWFQAIGKTMRDDAGIPLRVAGLFLDIHERVLATEREQQLRNQLKYFYVLLEDINKLIHELEEKTF